ncbi:MAG: DNA repair protein RadA [Lachnospiraceae bacterium]|nr:DNA repair protein RadA [Lachnospiraceae bacterium]
MAVKKDKSVFFCQNCGYESSKWLGQCPGCREWNTFVEERVKSASAAAKFAPDTSGALRRSKPEIINNVSFHEQERIKTGIDEFDRVLGGGLVKGSLTLIGGDPGIGKSTLLLQVCRQFAKDGLKVLYISGEESVVQIKMRADRIGKFSDSLFLMCETNLDLITDTVKESQPQIVVIDSIQTMVSDSVQSPAGSVAQVRESTSVLMQMAKIMGVSVFIVGHVTKEGTVAGPRVLEHMVDTVLYFEGDSHVSYRILRGVKNRFGSTDEIGVFEMTETGLSQVMNPSEYMLSGRPENASGAVVACCMEGTRPILLELQALICRTNFGFPKRQANGTDYNRLNILMAVLEKRVGLQIADCDAYVNLAGGLKINEPALDLAIVMAVVSGYKNKPLDPGMVFFGEVGLSGEVRSVSYASQRIREALKLGFTTCVLPSSNLAKTEGIKGIKLIGVRSVKEAMDLI